MIDGEDQRTPNTERVFLGLGSNEGDRHQFLEDAIRLLGTHDEVSVVQQSTVLETAPVSHIKQGDYLNQVIEIKTALEPESLLDVCLSTEAALGRVRQERWGPRTIDIDILFYGQRIIEIEGLRVPHPEVHKRSFMLIPLAEIAPEYQHPVFQSTIKAMMQLL